MKYLPFLLICLVSPFVASADKESSYRDKIYVEPHQYREHSNGVTVFLDGDKIHVPKVYKDGRGTFILEREMRDAVRPQEGQAHRCTQPGCRCLETQPEWSEGRIPLDEW